MSVLGRRASYVCDRHDLMKVRIRKHSLGLAQPPGASGNDDIVWRPSHGHQLSLGLYRITPYLEIGLSDMCRMTNFKILDQGIGEVHLQRQIKSY
jgi:hypothetical protein